MCVATYQVSCWYQQTCTSASSKHVYQITGSVKEINLVSGILWPWFWPKVISAAWIFKKIDQLSVLCEEDTKKSISILYESRLNKNVGWIYPPLCKEVRVNFTDLLAFRYIVLWGGGHYYNHWIFIKYVCNYQ